MSNPVRPRTDRPGDVGRPWAGHLVGRCGGREAALTRGQLLIQPEKPCKCQPLIQPEKLCLNSARGAARREAAERPAVACGSLGLSSGSGTRMAAVRRDSDGRVSPGLGWLQFAGTRMAAVRRDSDGCGSPGLGWPPPGAGGKGRPGLSGSAGVAEGGVKALSQP